MDVQLSDILNCIENGDLFLWSLQWITAIGKPGDEEVLSFEKSVNRSSIGLLYSWRELLDLANRFYQIIELLVCGDQHPMSLRRYEYDEEMNLRCDYVFELVDSSYWLVSSNDESAILRMQRELAGVSVC
ncbi:hypothetical protein [Chitinophaga sp. sic0106]|uniref:hypothetical protein n=1 Tax=Chitinophaga sp. sic0106 TaxID=2854785 RepID=UPI001C4744FC|nr:hypothetical protein [Chitinophaga sp. sic0106]MBV7529745.1 hypothetical protein [Chitinophaga sp. sic0106]